MLAARVRTSFLSTIDGAAFAETVERNAKPDEKSKLSKQLEVQINTVQSQVRKAYSPIQFKNVTQSHFTAVEK